MNGYALAGEPLLHRLLAELRAAAHTTDVTGLRRAIEGLHAILTSELGVTVAMCWIAVAEQLDDASAVDVQRRLLADGLCTRADLLHAIRARAVRHGRERGFLHAELFDLVQADPVWAGALDDVTPLAVPKQQ